MAEIFDILLAFYEMTIVANSISDSSEIEDGWFQVFHCSFIWIMVFMLNYFWNSILKKQLDRSFWKMLNLRLFITLFQ